MESKQALLIVDIQNDFCPGGALAVPEGDAIISALNKYVRLFSEKKLPVFVSRDWHPDKTSHFKQYGGQWPSHCVQGTEGAEFHRKLKLPKEAVVLSKGMDPGVDSYSAFQGKDSSGRSFSDLLNMLGIQELFIGGLATDYCVRHSVLDALKKNFSVRLLIDAVKGVDINAGDSARAVSEMAAHGARETELKTVEKLLG